MATRWSPQSPGVISPPMPKYGPIAGGSFQQTPTATGIIWGEEVGAADGVNQSSQYGTSYNPETGKVQFIAGYNYGDAGAAPSAPAAAPSAPTTATAGGRVLSETDMYGDSKQRSSSKSSSKSTSSKAVSGLKSATPPPPTPPAATSAPVAETSNPSNVIRASMPTTPTGGSGGGGIGGGPGLEFLEAPTTLRQGLGQRTLPSLMAPLAGLRKAY